MSSTPFGGSVATACRHMWPWRINRVYVFLWFRYLGVLILAPGRRQRSEPRTHRHREGGAPGSSPGPGRFRPCRPSRTAHAKSPASQSEGGIGAKGKSALAARGSLPHLHRLSSAEYQRPLLSGESFGPLLLHVVWPADGALRYLFEMVMVRDDEGVPPTRCGRLHVWRSIVSLVLELELALALTLV